MTDERSSTCQCVIPDICIEIGGKIMCCICGGDISIERARIEIFDPLADIADARREARFGKQL